ncbi:MAG: hypothetical protein Q7S40_32450 [Opitutaceae bacterium]|nr:hypothetical protein [Opitutaceae bacterium]
MAAVLERERLARLPGWEIVSTGLADVAAGRLTPAACAVWIASPRLRAIGLLDDTTARPITDPERVLYGLLRKEPGDPYSRYNALLRRLMRFERALDREVTASPNSPAG